LAERLFPAFDGGVLRLTYRKALQDQGLATAAGRLRLDILTKTLIEGLDQLSPIVDVRRADIATRADPFLALLRPGGSGGSTFAHLCLIFILFGSWAAFNHAYDFQLALYVPAEKVDKNRPNTEAGDCHPSLDTPKKEAKRERARGDLVKLRAAEPTLLRSRYSRRIAASFKWLLRNDHTWLQAHLPPALPRNRYYDTWVDWETRDLSYLEMARKYIETLKRPLTGRITPATLVREMPPLTFQLNLSRMPRTRSYLKVAAATLLAQRRKH
jgi:hypothetical protein